MITEETQKKVASFFSMSVLNTSEHITRDDDGKVIDEFRPSHFWVVEIMDSSVNDYWQYTMAAIHTDKWHKGLLLIPNRVSPDSKEFAGPMPLTPVAIEKDFVMSALHCVDLTPANDKGYGVLDGMGYSFQFFINATNTYSFFNVHMADNGLLPHYDRIRDAIVQMTYHLVEKYDDADIREHISTSSFWRI